MSYVIHINGHDYPVAAEHITTLQENLLSAAHAGGGFVDIPLPTREGTTALVFPGSTVWIETTPPEITANELYESFQQVFIDLDDEPFTR